MSQTRGFVHGAMLLAGAAALSKLLGSVYTIVLQNIIGDRGMGLFQMAYPIYATLLAIATAGFPVAISKLVSERLAVGDADGARTVFRVAAAMLSAAGIVCFLILFFGARPLAAMTGDAEAAWAIRAIAPALLLVPMLSAWRGYFQGFQWMEPTAVSQVLEQLVRVVTIILLSVWLTNAGYGQPRAAAGAAFGAVTGALAAFLQLLYTWWRRHPQLPVVADAPRSSAFGLSKRIVYYAFPISLGAMVVPLMNNIDVITVVNLLKHSGFSQANATTQFGLLTGRAFKLMMLPTTLAAGIGIAVMPAVSEAFTLGFRRLVWDRMDMAIRLTILLALPAAVGLTLLAAPVDITLFKDTSGSSVIEVMAAATVFASLQTTVAAVLQGCGYVYLPVLNLLGAAVVKLAANLLLVPLYGIRGAALATVVSYLAAAVLNFVALTSCLQVGFAWRRWFLRPAVAVFIMGAVVYAAARQWLAWDGLDWTRTATAAALAGMILLGGVVYGLALLLTGSLEEQELASIPKVGPLLAAWCSRLGLLR
ncbi:putative polysaccharide biosynthesis protein [Alicyclobacillus shizuokensis]|uniref:putative polysaccharide biosynthesis protein n=1 Tax=Alicyclobacillus shizuokensis TaxID=392014 RepID=UPI0008337466|nr:polysaccharide biosynthesis protein [Alicyclobacillus shizuokensis]